MQLLVSVHDAAWDPDEYLRGLVVQQQQKEQQEQQQQQSSTAGSSTLLGPFRAVASWTKAGGGQVLHLTQLLHNHQLDPYTKQSSPFEMVLQEKVCAYKKGCVPA